MVAAMNTMICKGSFRRWGKWTAICLVMTLIMITSLQNRILRAHAQADPANEVIQLVNELRVSYGQIPYQVDPILMSVAQAHASWSAANNISSHLGPDGKDPDERAKAAGYGAGFNAFVIENVASGTMGLNTPELVVSMWQGDYGHLNAMISPDYEDIGVGYSEGFGMSWFVMNVGFVDEGFVASPTTVAQPTQNNPSINTGNSFGFVVSTPDENGGVYHEVQEGQSAWTIAVIYEIDLADLLALNRLNENSFIYPGDLLLIRSPATSTNTPEPSPLPRTITPTAPNTQDASFPSEEDPQSQKDETSLKPVVEKGTSQNMIPIYITLVLVVINFCLAIFIIITRPRWG